VKREHEVALRTHVEKIINFTRTIALLSQQQRLRVNVGELEFLIAEPEDFLRAARILQTAIMETVSRIEKRQQEALRLFTNTDVSLNKNDVAAKLKVATKTAYRMLKTLANAGYLKEETQSKTYQYQLMQKEPENLDLLQNIQLLRLFHQRTLETWISTVEAAAQAKGIPLKFNYPPKQEPHEEEKDNAAQPEQRSDTDLRNDNPTRSSVPMPSQPDSSLENKNRNNQMIETQMSTYEEPETEKTQESKLNTIDDFASVHWSNTGYGWHPCGVCGQTKLTCCQGDTFKNKTVWLCEDCQTKWERTHNS